MKAKSLGLRAKSQRKRRVWARRPLSGPQPFALSPQRAFTLVEMLVAVALVLLLMTLFAQVFQIAGGSISTQRGLMENDQRARSVQTLIAGDINKRTFRYVLPFALNEDVSQNAPEANLFKRRGYFSISENNDLDDTDDVLAMTVDARVLLDSKDELPYYGRATPIWPNPIPTGGTAPQVPTSVAAQFRDDYFFRVNSNQPETDDSRLDFNQAGSSPAAEIVYFLRNGNLYRRVLLIRQPSSGNLTNEQPDDVAGNTFFTRGYTPVSPSPSFTYPGGFSVGFDSTGASTGAPANFWRHFDYSAHPRVAFITANNRYEYTGLQFNGVSSLQIASPLESFPRSTATTAFIAPSAIAYPPNRFGFNTLNPFPLTATSEPPVGGQPREYGTGGWWVGRLTMEESSNAGMGYPMLTHNPTSATNDANNDFNTATTWDDTNSDGIIDDFAGGPWRGEDLLLANVHAFDVKVWDDALSRFVDVGHSIAGGDYHLSTSNPSLNRQRNPYYGPNWGSNRVFDTWYPFFTEDLNNANGLDGAETATGFIPFDSNFDTDNDGAQDVAEDRNADGLVTIQALNFDPVNGTQPVVWADLNNDTVIESGENAPPFRAFVKRPVAAAPNYVDYERWVQHYSGGSQRYNLGSKVFPPSVPQSVQHGDPFYYVCVRLQEQGTADGNYYQSSSPPVDWPRTPGLTFVDNEVVWQAVDNRRPLRAIQITLRFVDPTTGQMRTLTLQQSLVD
jgi:prepilin-type N-terminal cleavage/methylation domain-containing protein